MNFRDAITWFLIILVTILVVYLVFFVQKESYKCLSNAPVYSIGLMEENSKANVTCICSTDKIGVGQVILTHDGFSPLQQASNSPQEPFNLDNVTIN